MSEVSQGEKVLDALVAGSQPIADAADSVPGDDLRFSKRMDTDAPAELTDVPKPRSSDKWSDQPSIKNQLAEQPATCRFLPVETELIKLVVGACEGKARLDELHAMSHGEAPRVRIIKEEAHFRPEDGAYFVLIRFSKIEYMKI